MSQTIQKNIKLQISDLAPDFKMMISESSHISLSDFVGRNVLMYFYPKDNTPGCTLESCDFNSRLDQFKELNTVVIGVSKDSIESHNKFKKRYNLDMLLASDPDGVVSNKYGVFIEKSMFGKKYMGIQRSTFLINVNGIIEYIWYDVSVFGHANEVLEFIKNTAK